MYWTLCRSEGTVFLLVVVTVLRMIRKHRMNIAQLAVDGIAEFGEYESWHCDGRWYTNRELVESGCRLATVLAEKDVRPGDRVVVMMMSCMEVPQAFHAIARLGAVAVPIMPQLIPREINYIVENSGC